MKTAVYTGTRNLYPSMVTSAKSLIWNSSVEKIYFLIEDDAFPESLPDLIETRNVSGQTIFPPNGPNMKTKFTYMAMIRVCYTKLLPEVTGNILQLDADTVIVDNVDGLWNVDMAGKWFAAVRERTRQNPYYNIGVALFNLDAIRQDHADDFLINFLNTEEAEFVDQDAWNKFGIWKDVALKTRFNETWWTGFTDNPAIVHYAGEMEYRKSPKVPRLEYAKKYEQMTWDEVMKKRKEQSHEQ